MDIDYKLIKRRCQAIIDWYEDGECEKFDPKLIYILLGKLKKNKKITNNQAEAINNIYMNFDGIENYID